MKNNTAGKWAEFLARMYLRCGGWQIVGHNYITGRGTKAGEIDIIAKRGKTLIFVEVKKRADLETAAYAIAPTQQARIRRGAEVFLQKHPQYRDYTIRFDAVLVQLPFFLRRLPNAF